MVYRLKQHEKDFELVDKSFFIKWVTLDNLNIILKWYLVDFLFFFNVFHSFSGSLAFKEYIFDDKKGHKIAPGQY